MAGKYSELWKKKKDEDRQFESKTESSSAPKMKWFYPNKAVKDSEKGTYIVRVLPVEGKDSWYYEFLKHSFKVGSWKNCLCLETSGKNGKPIGDCPICDFLTHNEEELKDNPNVKSLKAKTSYGLLVYDYQDKEIKRLELNFYGFRDILGAIASNEDEEFETEIDTEGFNLHYGTGDDGWAKIIGVNRGKKTIKEIKEALGIDAIPSVEDLTTSFKVESTQKVLNGMLDLALNAGMFPEVDGGNHSSSKRRMLDDDDSGAPTKKTPETKAAAKSVSTDDEPPFDVEEKSASKSKPKPEPEKKTTMSDAELNELLEGFDIDSLDI